MTQPDTLKTWPEKIYLQHGAPELPPYSECAGVTFADENVHGNDVGYTRDDLALLDQPALIARIEELEAERRWIPVRSAPPLYTEIEDTISEEYPYGISFSVDEVNAMVEGEIIETTFKKFRLQSRILPSPPEGSAE